MHRLQVTVHAAPTLRMGPFIVAGTVLLGIMYAGTVNIMLNGLCVVLTSSGKPGFLPAKPVEAEVAE